MTPTALLADYVLPIASKLEKPMCATHEDFAPNIACSEAAVEPLGERHGDYFVWKGLAERLGFGEYFPWQTEEELADERLAPLGLTFQEVATEKYFVRSDQPWTYTTINPRTEKPTGFATPSGKVELYSQVLERARLRPSALLRRAPGESGEHARRGRGVSLHPHHGRQLPAHVPFREPALGHGHSGSSTPIPSWSCIPTPPGLSASKRATGSASRPAAASSDRRRT